MYKNKINEREKVEENKAKERIGGLKNGQNLKKSFQLTA